jgi:nucleotide-binding universal stress UspA family protein
LGGSDSSTVNACPAGIGVGVDGSDDSLVALRAAARAASLSNATLVVVTAWLQAPTFGRTPAWLPDFQCEAEAMQQGVLREAFGDAPLVAIRSVARGGIPGSALVHDGEGARSSSAVAARGGFGSLLLGSTPRSVVTRAHCSVLVIGRDARTAPTTPGRRARPSSGRGRPRR